MTSRQEEIQLITSTAQLRSIASPKRLQIIRALEQLREGSVKEIATQVGAKKESVYYHVHALLKSGIIVRHGQRSTNRRDEAVYRLKSKSVEIHPRHLSKAFLEAMADLVSAGLRLSDRQHRAALLNPDTVVTGPDRERGYIQTQARLNKSSLRKLNRMMEDVYEFIHDQEVPEGEGVSYSVSMLIHPTSR